jgi:GntR family transcriptional regulator
LPTAREVVAALAINPNTVLKAYTQLESEGLVVSRPGLGTFIAQGIPAPLAPATQRQLRRGLDAWIRSAAAAGLDREGMLALINLAMDETEVQVA